MSTFGGLHTAYSGLNAARAAIEVTGQNISNATTAGYTRQRVTQESVGATGAGASIFVSGTNIGTGVSITGVQRIDDQMVDQRLRSATASSNYWSVASGTMDTVEASLGEPSDTGLSATLGDFWASWQALSNNPTLESAGQSVISEASKLTAQIASGYQTAATNWSQARDTAVDTVARINTTAQQIAQLNTAIRVTVAGGGSANELIDQRATLIGSLSGMTGATVRNNTDSTVDVIVGGYTMVGSGAARQLAVVGAASLPDAAASPVHVEWADKPGTTVEIDGGSLAGSLTSLAPAAAGGTGGPFAEQAALYNSLATNLAAKVNAVHATGTNSTGATNLAFFSFSAGSPAATGLTVVPTTLAGIATGASGSGAANGSLADAIGKIGDAADGPDRVWASYVVNVGTQARNATTQATLTSATLTTATTAQSSQNAVDLDEETTNLITFQHAYQGAARMMTAIDEMLDVLINRTGLVGR